MGFGGFGCDPQVTDDWGFHLRERRTHAGKSTSKPRLPVKPSYTETPHTSQSKSSKRHEKLKKGANRDRLITSAATHQNHKQNVPEVAKKLGLQPERRGWENRYGRCLFAAFVVLLLEHPPFACWSAGYRVYLKTDLGKPGLGGNLHSS